MADFDDWGDPQGGQTPEQEDDGWGDWGAPSPSDDFGPETDDFPTSQPDAMQPQQGNFIPQDDDGWGSTSGVEEQQFTSQDQDDFASSQAEVQEFQPRQFNLSMKKVAIIILVASVVVALIFLGLDKIHIKSKPPVQNNNPPVTQQSNGGSQGQTQGNQGQQTEQQPSTSPVDVDSVTLVEIPETMDLDYNGDVLTANGKVLNKLKYVQGHQVLYCVNIGVAFAGSSETVSYYCNFSSFNAVKEGDIVILSYQQVNDSYISVISISK